MNIVDKDDQRWFSCNVDNYTVMSHTIVSETINSVSTTNSHVHHVHRWLQVLVALGLVVRLPGCNKHIRVSCTHWKGAPRPYVEHTDQYMDYLYLGCLVLMWQEVIHCFSQGEAHRESPTAVSGWEHIVPTGGSVWVLILTHSRMG